VHVATSALRSQNSYSELRGVRVHRFDVQGNRALGMSGEMERYRRFVRSGDWDVVVNHCFQAWPTDALFDEMPAFPWPSVLVSHGLSADNPLFEAYYREIPRYVSAYRKWVRVSNGSGELSFATRSHLPVPPAINNGVDMSEWTRRTLGLRQAWGVHQKPWVINLSNHSPQKGHRDFFQLAKPLRLRGARVTLIGGTYPMNKWGLGRLGIQGGCAYECHLRTMLSLGAVDLKVNLPRAQVVSAIQEANVVVVTSHLEANSVVLLESMAAGKPWVSFDVGSARENAGGVVTKDLDEMVSVVTELLRDPDRRKNLGSAGRARALAKHDWDSITDQYEELYQSVLKDYAPTHAHN
jgi:L-malate glycosyltransferase